MLGWLKIGEDEQNIYYLIEEIADTLKMRICCNPPGKYPLKQELVAITEAEAKLHQVPAGRRGQGALQPPLRTASEGRNC